ncbi:MAG: AbrB/MazE/SpoVT family DNA-binding domain-containing protein [Armatimonadota bacterium]|nr:AbrB/MazE/SpoVT family DNA-binding domain-containing protein [Armatimonadota bacterium]
MSIVVKTRIVKIGNSHGIRIPKLLLEQVGLTGQVEVEVQSDQLVIRPLSESPRHGWEDQFKKMAAQGDDQLLDGELVSSSQWDKDEWEW